MSLEESLKRVERDVAAGDYGRARDRLHGLIGAYPERMDLRRRLGDVYGELRYPSMAGRFWYLEEEKSPEMEAACRAFEKSCGNNPVLMLQALKYRGGLRGREETFAGKRLAALAARAQREHGYRHNFERTQTPAGVLGLRESLGEKLLSVGCTALVVTAVVLMIVGLITILRFVFGD